MGEEQKKVPFYLSIWFLAIIAIITCGFGSIISAILSFIRFKKFPEKKTSGIVMTIVFGVLFILIVIAIIAGGADQRAVKKYIANGQYDEAVSYVQGHMDRTEWEYWETLATIYDAKGDPDAAAEAVITYLDSDKILDRSNKAWERLDTYKNLVSPETLQKIEALHQKLEDARAAKAKEESEAAERKRQEEAEAAAKKAKEESEAAEKKAKEQSEAAEKKAKEESEAAEKAKKASEEAEAKAKAESEAEEKKKEEEKKRKKAEEEARKKEESEQAEAYQRQKEIEDMLESGPVTMKEVIRDPDSYIGQNVYMTMVIGNQFEDDPTYYSMYIVEYKEWGWDKDYNNKFIVHDVRGEEAINSLRLLEGDIVEVCGKIVGVNNFKSTIKVTGATSSEEIPVIDWWYGDMIGDMDND